MDRDPRPIRSGPPEIPEQVRKWGNVARRGARELGRSEEERKARGRDDRVKVPSGPPAPMDRWVRADSGTSEWEDDLPWGGAARTRRAPAPLRSPYKPKPLPADVAAEIRRAADTATAHHREVLVDKMTDAVAAYDRGRYQEAARLGKQVANETPGVAAVRDLVGLSAYRCGRWREAVRQLDAYGRLTDDVDHLPALMDCNRALGKPRNVAKLWAELRRRSPEPDVMAEGRMVAAGMLSDRGDLTGAISLLAAAGVGKALRNPSDRHLRQWYALGDLYERAGDLPRARELFLRVARAEPDAYDLADRLVGLGASQAGAGRAASDRRRRNRKRTAKPKSTKTAPVQQSRDRLERTS